MSDYMIHASAFVEIPEPGNFSCIPPYQCRSRPRLQPRTPLVESYISDGLYLSRIQNHCTRMSTEAHTVHIGTLTVTYRFTVSRAAGNYARYIWDSGPIIIVGEILRYKFQSKNVMTRTAVSHSDSDPDELDGLDGISGLDEPTNHGWCRKSDTSGRRSGSSTSICRSNVINPGVSSTLEKDRTLCSREVL